MVAVANVPYQINIILHWTCYGRVNTNESINYCVKSFHWLNEEKYPSVIYMNIDGIKMVNIKGLSASYISLS